MTPILYWMRRDLRLTDNPALTQAAETGRPVIPVFVFDEVVADWGAAPSWRIGLSLQSMAGRLQEIGARLILRRGRARDVLRALVAETGAGTVCWNRLYVADERERDAEVEAALEADGVETLTHQGHVLFEPWTVKTKTDGYYKVYTPYWKNVRDRDLAPPLAPVETLTPPETWPASDDLSDWSLGAAMDRGAEVVAGHVHVGELAARDRLVTFIEEKIDHYVAGRDDLGVDGTSGLSENLTYGEISARECWFAGQKALHEGEGQAETFLQELAWRDFAHHLAYFTPRLTKSNWRPEFDAFPWDWESERVEAWRRGVTGVEVVDAAMRELYVTGRMHNRARMIAGSYLTKHLMTHWRLGCDWFADALIDWDPASNALGWQWVAGSGPDASPFFRIFNPETQAQKFDRLRRYRDRWLKDEAFYAAIPRRWAMSPDDPYPDAPIVGLAEGRERALEAYRTRDAA